MPPSKRILWMDALKLFAIFLVLWGHCVQHLLSSHHLSEPTYRFIYAFHMPLFMMISGFFAAGIVRRTFWEAFWQKARQLLLPALSFGLILIAIRIHRHQTVGLGTLFSSFWFLKSAFICSGLYFVATKWSRSPWWLVLTLLFSQTMPLFQVPVMYPCFLVGVYIRRHLEWFERHLQPVLWTSLALFLALYVLREIFSDPLAERDILGKALYRIYKIPLGVAGSVACIALFDLLSAHVPAWPALRTVGEWGKYTLGIYTLQSIILEDYMQRHLNFDTMGFAMFNFVVSPLISVGVLLVCLGLIRLIRCSRWTAWLLLGEPIPQAGAQGASRREA